MLWPIFHRRNIIKDNTYIKNHFTAFAGSYLLEELQNEGLCHIPGQISHIPTREVKRWQNQVLVKQEVVCRQRLGTGLAFSQHDLNAAMWGKKNLTWKCCHFVLCR